MGLLEERREIWGQGPGLGLAGLGLAPRPARGREKSVWG